MLPVTCQRSVEYLELSTLTQVSQYPYYSDKVKKKSHLVLNNRSVKYNDSVISVLANSFSPVYRLFIGFKTVCVKVSIVGNILTEKVSSKMVISVASLVYGNHAEYKYPYIINHPRTCTSIFSQALETLSCVLMTLGIQLLHNLHCSKCRHFNG